MTRIKTALFAVSLLGAFCASVVAPNVYADSITASYAQSSQSVGYETYESARITGTISMNLLTYLRFDFSYSNEDKLQKGYKEYRDSVSGEESLRYFENLTKVNGLGLNLAIILYNGATIVPYVFGGVQKNVYEFTYVIEGEDGTFSKLSSKTDPIISPNYGLGMAIMLTRSFSIRTQYSMRPGVAQKPGEDAAKVWDKSLDVGLTWNLN